MTRDEEERLVAWIEVLTDIEYANISRMRSLKPLPMPKREEIRKEIIKTVTRDIARNEERTNRKTGNLRGPG